MQTQNRANPWQDGLGRVSIRAGQLLMLLALTAVLIYGLIQVRLVVIPLLLALILAAAIAPLVNWLRRKGWPSAAATGFSFLLLLLALGGLVTAIVFAVIGQAGELARSAMAGFDQVYAFVRTGPIPVDDQQIQQARDALVEADENSWSPQETRMRGVWTRRAGLPRPLCNAPVFTLDGRHVGTPDLVDPETGLAGQYNGSDHLSLVGAATDVKQEAAYRDLGLETVTMLATDWRDLDGFVERLHAAARRARSGPRSRAWTVDPPDWWTPTHTVARRRALDAEQRARLLRYRRAA